jgi:vesicle coat complex subunit
VRVGDISSHSIPSRQHRIQFQIWSFLKACERALNKLLLFTFCAETDQCYNLLKAGSSDQHGR